MYNITYYDLQGNELSHFYQYDINQSITISGLNTSLNIAVHFYNETIGEVMSVSPTISGANFVVKVPNILLEYDDIITLYIYQKTGADNSGTRTIGSINIPVVPRTALPYYIYAIFLSEDGSIELGREKISIDSDAPDPILSGLFSTPVKPSDADYNYDFDGWSTVIGGSKNDDVLLNLTETRYLYAHFNITPRIKANLIFMSEDGSEELGRELIYDGENGFDPIVAGMFNTPAKVSTAQYTFSFDGWSKTVGGEKDNNALLSVMSDRILYAHFKSTLRTYIVSFYNNGQIIATQPVLYGGNASYVGTPSKAPTTTISYVFSGWSREENGVPSETALTNITGDTSVFAQFTEEPRLYTVTFRDSAGNIIEEQTTEYLGSVSYSGLTPTKQSTAQYNYTFDGWSNSATGEIISDILNNITEDKNVYAHFSSTIRSYVVYFYNESNLLLSQVVYYGENTTYTGDTPVKASTTQYDYIFDGWSLTPDGTASEDALNNITSDRNVYAHFTSKSLAYIVTFYNGNTVLGTQEVFYGDNAVYTGVTPLKQSTARYDYTFSGWGLSDEGGVLEGALENITENRNVYAQYTSSLRNYTVTFYNGDTVLATQTVTYGNNATYTGDTPTKASTAQYNYIFNGWSNSATGEMISDILNNITEDKNVYAYFASIPKIFAVKFYNGTTLLSTVAVPYGGTATYNGDTPTKASTAQYDYTFDGWSATNGGSKNDTILNNITASKNVYAHFSSAPRSYTVSFYNGTTLLLSKPVPYGGTAIYDGATPTKASSNTYNYTFDGWSATNGGSKSDTILNNITANKNVYAHFVSSYIVVNNQIMDSWAAISASVADGSYSNKYSVGNYKNVTLTYPDSSKETLQVEIIGKNHDNLSSGGKAGLTFMFVQALKDVKHMNYEDKTYKGYSYHSSGGWGLCDARTYLNETIFDALPSDLRNVIKFVDKEYDTGYNTYEVLKSSDKLWLLSTVEAGGGDGALAPGIDGLGTEYSDKFSNSDSRIKYYADNTTKVSWWTRSTYKPATSIGNKHSWYYVSESGIFVAGGGGSDQAIIPAFCI